MFDHVIVLRMRIGRVWEGGSSGKYEPGQPTPTTKPVKFNGSNISLVPVVVATMELGSGTSKRCLDRMLRPGCCQYRPIDDVVSV